MERRINRAPSKRTRKNAISIEQKNALKLLRQTRNRSYAHSSPTKNDIRKSKQKSDDDDDDDDDNNINNNNNNNSNNNNNNDDDDDDNDDDDEDDDDDDDDDEEVNEVDNRIVKEFAETVNLNKFSERKINSLHDSFKKHMKVNSIDHYTKMYNNNMNNLTNKSSNTNNPLSSIDSDGLLDSLLQHHAENSPKSKRTKYTPHFEDNLSKVNISSDKLVEAFSHTADTSYSTNAVTDEVVHVVNEDKPADVSLNKSDYIADSKPTLSLTDIDFFIFDAAVTNAANASDTKVILFGKVETNAFTEKSNNNNNNTNDTTITCSCVIQDLPRVLYLLPRYSNDSSSFSSSMFTNIYDEFDKIATQYHIKNYKSRLVTKKFCFNPQKQIPKETEYLEVRYSQRYPKLPNNITGTHFSHLFCFDTPLEILLLERNIKGPTWLKLTNVTYNSNQLFTLCKVECSVEDIYSIETNENYKQPPTLTSISLSFKTVSDDNNSFSQIVIISLIVNQCMKLDGLKSTACQNSIQYTTICKSQNTILPSKLKNLENSSNQGKKFEICQTERSMLALFFSRIRKIDPDILIGHDTLYFLDLLIHRAQQYKLAHSFRAGRMKNIRDSLNIPSKSSYSGIIICDIAHSCKELIRLDSYDISTIVDNVIHQKFRAIDSLVMKEYLDNSDYSQLSNCISSCIEEAQHILRIATELSIIPLAYHITKLAGNLITSTLLSGRSERNEFLLLHAFHSRNYICPNSSKDDKSMNNYNNKVSQKSSYEGGLVLDPLKGLYKNFILLLDFNSLYPSIIQEYNICFSTLELNISNDSIPDLSICSPELGVLPQELNKLVNRRKNVKSLMKNCDANSDEYLRLNISQKALKLTANSMYGCLGYANSRFYAKPLAALVTFKGREILQNTKDLVEQTLGLRVIYGDTDSIMIDTARSSIEKVTELGVLIKDRVNKLYKCIELDIESIYETLLLLKKKKYAAVSLVKSGSSSHDKIKEIKGLDIVRRDWSPVGKEAGDAVLNMILYEDLDTIQLLIKNYLNDYSVKITSGEISPDKFIVLKCLSKETHKYAASQALPHVSVAIWMKKNGYRTSQGDTIPYIYCINNDHSDCKQKAFHPDQLSSSTGNLAIDYQYYLEYQIYPIITRICAPIEFINSDFILEELGIRKNSTINNEYIEFLINDTFAIDFCNAESIEIPCYLCNTNISLLSTNYCSNCSKDIPHPISATQIALQCRNYIKRLYNSWTMCDDPTCQSKSRVVSKFSTATTISNTNNNCSFCFTCGESNYYTYTAKMLYTQLKLIEKNSEFCPYSNYFLHESNYANIALSDLFD